MIYAKIKLQHYKVDIKKLVQKINIMNCVKNYIQHHEVQTKLQIKHYEVHDMHSHPIIIRMPLLFCLINNFFVLFNIMKSFKFGNSNLEIQTWKP